MFAAAFNKEIDWLDDDIAVSAHASGYTPDQDNHDYVDDLTSEVANGNGYATGGMSLTGKTLTYSASTNTFTFDANDVQWVASTFTARTMVVRNNTPSTPATRPLLCYQQSDVDISSRTAAFDLIWNANGIFTIVVA